MRDAHVDVDVQTQSFNQPIVSQEDRMGRARPGQARPGQEQGTTAGEQGRTIKPVARSILLPSFIRPLIPSSATLLQGHLGTLDPFGALGQSCYLTYY